MTKSELKKLIKEVMSENTLYLIKTIDQDGTTEWYGGDRVSGNYVSVGSTIAFFNMSDVKSALNRLRGKGINAEVYTVPISSFQKI